MFKLAVLLLAFISVLHARNFHVVNNCDGTASINNYHNGVQRFVGGHSTQDVGVEDDFNGSCYINFAGSQIEFNLGNGGEDYYNLSLEAGYDVPVTVWGDGCASYSCSGSPCDQAHPTTGSCSGWPNYTLVFC